MSQYPAAQSRVRPLIRLQDGLKTPDRLVGIGLHQYHAERLLSGYRHNRSKKGDIVFIFITDGECQKDGRRPLKLQQPREERSVVTGKQEVE